MRAMTGRQIAQLCGVQERTVRRWIERASDKMSGLSDKMSEAFRKKRPARFSLDETIEIVRAGGNHTLADLLLENARKTEQDDRVRRLPNGKQIEEMRRVFGCLEAGIRLDFIIGYSPADHPLSKEEAARRLRQIRDGLGQQLLPGMAGN